MGRSEMSGMYSAVLTRQLAYTTLPCTMAPEILAEMGMVPPSPEGEEAEHRAGHEKKNALIPLVGAMAPMVGITADLLARAMLESASEKRSGDERDVLTAHYLTIINQAVIGIVAQLIHMNVLAPTVDGGNEFLG